MKGLKDVLFNGRNVCQLAARLAGGVHLYHRAHRSARCTLSEYHRGGEVGTLVPSRARRALQHFDVEDDRQHHLHDRILRGHAHRHRRDLLPYQETMIAFTAHEPKACGRLCFLVKD